MRPYRLSSIVHRQTSLRLMQVRDTTASESNRRNPMTDTRSRVPRSAGGLAALSLIFAALLFAPQAHAAGGCFHDTPAGRAPGTVVVGPGPGADEPGARGTASPGGVLGKNLNLQ